MSLYNHCEATEYRLYKYIKCCGSFGHFYDSSAPIPKTPTYRSIQTQFKSSRGMNELSISDERKRMSLYIHFEATVKIFS